MADLVNCGCERFRAHIVFGLATFEAELLRCQIGTSKKGLESGAIDLMHTQSKGLPCFPV
jgi:hypothetical protein